MILPVLEMNPQEIVLHKAQWMMANYYESHTHTDLRKDALEWCKAHCFSVEILTFKTLLQMFMQIL